MWHLNPNKTIHVSDIVPGDRIAFHVKKWNGLYKMEVARVEKQSDGTVRIKAGVSYYSCWSCVWHTLDKNEKIYFLSHHE